MLILDLQHTLTHCHTPTPRTLAAAALFGLNLDTQTTTELIPPMQLRLTPGNPGNPGNSGTSSAPNTADPPHRHGQIIFITGTSGGGKSTLLRCITAQLQRLATVTPATRIELYRLDADDALPDLALIDGFDDLTDEPEAGSESDTEPRIDRPLHWLGLAGLSDAHLILRKPGQLSEGQRHRFALARLIAKVELASAGHNQKQADGGQIMPVVIGDEFLTPLDRITAAAVSQAIARWARRSGVVLIVATAHDDLLESLNPDTLIDADPAGIKVSQRDLPAH